MPERDHFDVLIVGAGPAGMAACASAGARCRVGVVDQNPHPGGQIWRGGKGEGRLAAVWFERFNRAGAELLGGTEVIAQTEPRVLLLEREGQSRECRFEQLIIATGARERFIPFPGWTLPNVIGAGGLQSLTKGGLSVNGKKIAVAGSGPLLWAVADFLKRHGAEIVLIAEQAPWSRLMKFATRLPLRAPAKMVQAAGYKWNLLKVPFKAGCWPVAAQGHDRLEEVTFRCGEKTWNVRCDHLACGFGFLPNVELPRLLGCRLEEGFVVVDRHQETSLPGVFCAGEPTGIGGVDKALVEGQIAGHAAVRYLTAADRLNSAREKAMRFGREMEAAFAPRAELRELATPETIVCRCEDVSRGRLQPYPDWRTAKLHTRCGMGACQGRVCGPAAEFLFGWKNETIRPPIFPANVETFM
jgi:D-hydroxyproline dehydrogenase subunit alpha